MTLRSKTQEGTLPSCRGIMVLPSALSRPGDYLFRAFPRFLRNLIHLDDDMLLEVPYSVESSTPGSPLGKAISPK